MQGTAAGQSTCVFLHHDVVLAHRNSGRAAKRLLVENEYPVTSAGSFEGVGFKVVKKLPPNAPKKKNLDSDIKSGKKQQPGDRILISFSDFGIRGTWSLN